MIYADYNYPGVFYGVCFMKINLKRLKLHPRESEEFRFLEEGRDEFLGDVGGRFLAPLDVNVVVENTGKIFVGRAKVYTVLQLNCSRCLKQISYPIRTDLNITMVESVYKEEYSDSREDVIFFDQDEVDVQPYVEGAVYTEIPLNLLCNEGCKGLCPICGADKNIEECHCEREAIDPRWEKLGQLVTGRR